ncbi:hypothetical protein [Rhizohabitans arisaemae]|uniref:hypothetical protein n=1 Tax=Rhizohabitans arisaemae TaxID=2720610 RepID=UPI0024B1FB84|nr:hypothetical protein [Rhizohabitans arisaemae]
MKPNGTDRRGRAGLVMIGVVWLAGSLVLLMLTLEFGFALAGAEAKNLQLARALGTGALILGLGGPVIGLLAALLWRNKRGVVVYGLLMAAVAVLALMTML